MGGLSRAWRRAGSTTELERRLHAIQASDIGCLIYTSGTTGPPKAVQLSHGALASTAGLIQQLWDVSERDCALSYLPLAHIAERMITVHFPLTVGSAVYFAPDIQQLGQCLKEVRPHVFFGVPRIYEKIAAGAQLQIANAKGMKGKIARWAVRSGQEWRRKEQMGLRPGIRTGFAKALASRLVHRKAKKAIGFDRVRYFACGAAPIPEETLRFLNGLDIPVREIWGMSETCGAGTANLPGAAKLGSVGRAHPGIELKISPEGEILVRGPYLFSGYAKDPEATETRLPMAGSEPAISAAWTRMGSSPLPGARRTSSSPRAARTSRPPTWRWTLRRCRWSSTPSSAGTGAPT